MTDERYLRYGPAALDALYNTRLRVPEWETYAARFEQRSLAARAAHGRQTDLAYGPHPDERLDVLGGGGSMLLPAQVFFHGGYWRSAAKERYLYPAEAFVAAGAVYVAVEYALVPKVDLDTLIDQCRRAIGFLWREAPGLGIDRKRIYVSGHSAGGQIVGMLLADDGWQASHHVPPDVIKGGCGLSGLYEMEAMRRWPYLNDTLCLTPEQALRNSPAFLAPSGAPLIAAVGGDEGAEFLRQNALIDVQWSHQGTKVTTMVRAGLNHYSIVEELGDRASPLTRAMLSQMGLG